MCGERMDGRRDRQMGKIDKRGVEDYDQATWWQNP
jgi:hypothetical protein